MGSFFESFQGFASQAFKQIFRGGDVIQLDRQHLVLLLEVGYIYVGMQRFKEARQVFEGVQLLAPESDVPVIALGGVAFCEGDFKKAIQIYQKALKLVPDSLFAKAYLGEALLFAGKSQEADTCLKEVKKLDPKGAAGHFADTLLSAVAQGFDPKKVAEGKKRHAKTSRPKH